MNKFFLMLFSLVIFFFGSNWCFSQELSDTLETPSVSVSKPAQDLPPIEMEEYTIVGLAKVTLPKKERRAIFQDVKINWSENQDIYEKDLPAIAFQFSRIKPSLFRLYEFPWLDSRIWYGSYNTAGVQVNMQFKANRTMPYLSVGFEQSDGHVEKAEWTAVNMKAGIHQRIGLHHLLHLATDYSFSKKGIWGNPEAYPFDSEALTTFWNIYGNFEQHWTSRFRTEIGAGLYWDDHENILRYEDRGADFRGMALIDFGKTGIGLTADYKKSDIAVADGNWEPASPDSLLVNDHEYTLFDGLFYLKQRLDPVSLKAGVIYQKGEQKTVPGMPEKDNPEKVYPYAGISVKLGSKGTVYGRFRPGLELIRMRELVGILPFSDFSALRLQDHSSRWEAGFSLNVFPQFALDVLGRFSKINDYPAPVFPSDTVSILSAGSPVYYPGWLFGTLEEVKLNEITGKIDWKFIPSLRLFGWITFLHSDIRKNGQYSAGIRSNDVPYIPDISAYGRISWNFYRKHEITLYSRYAGNRFDDIQNRIELPAYFLLNAKLDLKLGEYMIIFLTGENLLDKKYDIWKGFSAPGLTGYAGIRLVL